MDHDRFWLMVHRKHAEMLLTEPGAKKVTRVGYEGRYWSPYVALPVISILDVHRHVLRHHDAYVWDATEQKYVWPLSTLGEPGSGVFKDGWREPVERTIADDHMDVRLDNPALGVFRVESQRFAEFEVLNTGYTTDAHLTEPRAIYVDATGVVTVDPSTGGRLIGYASDFEWRDIGVFARVEITSPRFGMVGGNMTTPGLRRWETPIPIDARTPARTPPPEAP